MLQDSQARRRGIPRRGDQTPAMGSAPGTPLPRPYHARKRLPLSLSACRGCRPASDGVLGLCQRWETRRTAVPDIQAPSHACRPPYPSPGWAETWSRGGTLRGTGAEDRLGACGLLGAARSRPAPCLRQAPRSGRFPLGRS